MSDMSSNNVGIYSFILSGTLLLPVLFILMLPSLIFSTTGLDTPPEDILNDTSLIAQNIAEVESSIESILRTKHDALLVQIQSEAESFGENSDYSIIDEFADRIIFESTLIISQFCASQDDYKDINLDRLESILIEHTDSIFSYSEELTLEEKLNEETNIVETIYHYTYTVQYIGDSYFSENVFFLTEEQETIADSYASNLHLFLFDSIYQVEFNPNLLPGETGNKAVSLALSKLGTTYSQEYRNEDGYFDCSSFSYWVFEQLGISLQYDGATTAAAQGRYIVENDLAIAYESLAPGDLVFYSFHINNRYMNIGHVGIYAGNGYIIDASSSKGKIVYRPIYNTNRIVLCGRPYTN